MVDELSGLMFTLIIIIKKIIIKYEIAPYFFPKLSILGPNSLLLFKLKDIIAKKLGTVA